MNTRQRELFDRLENALDTISRSPKTAFEVALIFENLVTSFEEIAEDLVATPDEEAAEALRRIVHGVILGENNTSTSIQTI